MGVAPPRSLDIQLSLLVRYGTLSIIPKLICGATELDAFSFPSRSLNILASLVSHLKIPVDTFWRFFFHAGCSRHHMIRFVAGPKFYVYKTATVIGARKTVQGPGGLTPEGLNRIVQYALVAIYNDTQSWITPPRPPS